MQDAANPDGLDQQKVAVFVDALTQFDRRMNQVVVDSGILKGIPKGRLRAAGKRPWRHALVAAYSSLLLRSRVILDWVHHAVRHNQTQISYTVNHVSILGVSGE